MTCPEIRELFSTHVDDALTADERAGLETHLATCAECRHEWERFEGMRVTVPRATVLGPERYRERFTSAFGRGDEYKSNWQRRYMWKTGWQIRLIATAKMTPTAWNESAAKSSML